jgi:phosphatidylserine decarboxylase
VSPADCRLNVFPSLDIATDIWIKGSKFNLESLFEDPALAAKYQTGSLVIARLAPQDYHRFHSPVTGRLTNYKVIEGAYYTVNPIAINKSIDVYCQNKRLVTEIRTKEFDDVCFVAVGATMVGSICMTAEEESKVHKGDELGYFAFGGSTTLVFFQHGRINYDDDLVVNSLKPIETLVKVGDSLGTAKPV